MKRLSRSRSNQAAHETRVKHPGKGQLRDNWYSATCPSRNPKPDCFCRTDTQHITNSSNSMKPGGAARRRWLRSMAAIAAFAVLGGGIAIAQQDRPDEGSARVTACESYADTVAGRQLQRDEELMARSFRGTSSRAFDDIARMDAEEYKRRLYESCLNSPRFQTREPAR
jgi:hypothetical protein